MKLSNLQAEKKNNNNNKAFESNWPRKSTKRLSLDKRNKTICLRKKSDLALMTTESEIWKSVFAFRNKPFVVLHYDASGI